MLAAAVRTPVRPPLGRAAARATGRPAAPPVLAPRPPATAQTLLAATLARAVARRSLLQRQVSKDTSSGLWVGDGDRPSWQVAAERSLVEGYNALHGTSVKKVPYTADQLDRCHKLSFKDIQDMLLEYLNTGDDVGYSKWLIIMVSDLPDWDKVEPAVRLLMNDVQSGASDSNIAKRANRLLGMLNSLTENLRAADKTLNSYIKEHLDPHGEYSPSGLWHADQETRRATLVATSEPLLTPEHRSRMVTSEGPVALGSISPRYARQLQGRDFDTMGAKSTNVLDKLYPLQGITKSKGSGKYTVDFNVKPARSGLGRWLVEYRELSDKKHLSSAEKKRKKLLRDRLRRAKLIS